jgi:hypothetical protein
MHGSHAPADVAGFARAPQCSQVRLANDIHGDEEPRARSKGVPFLTAMGAELILRAVGGHSTARRFRPGS